MLKILLMLSVCLLIATPAQASDGLKFSPSDLKMAKASFKYRGEWIHPKIIGEFLPLESDPAIPLVVAIDVNAATGTNRFFGKIEEKNGRASFTDGEGLSTSYEWKGRLRNGMHVLVVRRHGDGSMVSTHLAVFKISQKPSLVAKGKKYQRLLLEVERLVALGDRASAEVELAGNRVKVAVSCEKTCESRQLALTF